MAIIDNETRALPDIKVPLALGNDLLKFKDVKVPAGFFPAGYEFAEGFTLENLAYIVAEKLGITLPETGQSNGDGGGDNGGGNNPVISCANATDIVILAGQLNDPSHNTA